MLLIETFPVGLLQCNCSVIACEHTKEAIIIDPGGDADKIMEVVRHYDLKVTHLLHTHAHFDHIGASRTIKEKTGAPIYLHPGDETMYYQIKMQASLFGLSAEDPSPIDHFLSHQQSLSFGQEKTLTFHTPGHSPGSCCFHLETPDQKFLFSGDTLFKKSIGRTDLWGGSLPTILHSIKTTLFTLPEEVVVIPGHGPETSIGAEKAKNPFVR
jgi:hydroxyacylglutathione hydrolase